MLHTPVGKHGGAQDGDGSAYVNAFRTRDHAPRQDIVLVLQE